MPIKDERLARLTTLLREVENDGELLEFSHLQQRLEVLDRLEATCFRSTPLSPEAAIDCRVRALQTKLEAANAAVYAAIRRDIQRGLGRRSLLEWLPGSGAREPADLDRYDSLDDLIVGVLQFAEPEANTIVPVPEMIVYQPTPARHIFDLLELTALTADDVLFDIGSGLGHVPLLTSIFTPARSVGVELEPAYVKCARQAAESLNLSRVTFLQQDARSADFTRGSVFYLYTPFTGAMLGATLDLLRQQASHRVIRICTFGPCTPVIAAENWLDAVGPVRAGRISVFQSVRSAGSA